MAVYTPQTPPRDPASLVSFLETELRRISAALSEQEIAGYELQLLSVAPERPRTGLIVNAAAGVIGDNEGLYRFGSDGVWYFMESGALEWTVATAVNVVVGGAPTGTVADVQAWNDGNVFSVPEVAATPGFDVRFTIPNANRFTRMASNIWYTGLLSHQVEFQIYNVTTTTWETVTQVPGGPGYNYRYVGFPNDPADYIDGSGNVTVRVYHVAAGNASHVLNVDFIALVD